VATQAKKTFNHLSVFLALSTRIDRRIFEMCHLPTDEPHWSQFTNENNNRGALARGMIERKSKDLPD
jgi:hypothetical protein